MMSGDKHRALQFLVVINHARHDSLTPTSTSYLSSTTTKFPPAMLVPSAYLALPAVKTVVDCADYGKTVQPFLEQLNTLPQRILAAGVSLDAQKAVYISTNPLIFGLAFSLFLVPIFLVVSEANRNYSQVDRCWSILPTVYNAHFTLWAHMNGLPTQKLDNVLAFSTLWSVSTWCSALRVARHINDF